MVLIALFLLLLAVIGLYYFTQPQQRIVVINEHPSYSFFLNKALLAQFEKEYSEIFGSLDAYRSNTIVISAGPRNENEGYHIGTLLGGEELYNYSGFNRFLNDNNEMFYYLYIDSDAQNHFDWHQSVIELEMNSRLLEAVVEASKPGFSQEDRNSRIRPLLYRMQEQNSFLLEIEQ